MNQDMKKGYLIVSLDFELLWGVHDHETKETFYNQVKGARSVIPKLLDLFSQYNIHATWAMVGMLMADSKDELLDFVPNEVPTYKDTKFSSYQYFDLVGKDEIEDPYHFAASFIDLLSNTNNQEIASHTFSHYYCKSEGQTLSQFAEDMDCAQRMMNRKTGKNATSLVFPRNQYTDEYAKEAAKHGMKCVRGNPKSFAYNGKKLTARIVRFLDTYINICGMKCSSINDCIEDGYVNIQASRFFRKYNKKLSIFEPLKISCIKRQMKYAAKNNKIFHLWWHPHNISIHSVKSIEQLHEIFNYYRKLKDKYNFESLTMSEMAQIVNND